jgi:PAS domain S-box-containing protein
MTDDIPGLDYPILAALLDLLPGTLHVKDRELRYQVVNRNYLERWGATHEQVIGRTSAEVFGDRFGHGPDDRNRQVLQSGRTLPFYEVSHINEAGHEVILWATKVPLLDERGEATHVLTYSLDITSLKDTERQLDESERLRSTVVEHALDCFITIDESGSIVEFNPAAERVFGLSRTEVIGREVGEVLIPPGLDAAHRHGLARCTPGSLSERGGRRFETLAQRGDGTIFPIELSVAEIPLEGRRLFTACLRELSARHEAELALEQQRQDLSQSERLSVLGTLAAEISHEIRNPLSVILAQASLLQSSLEGSVHAERIAAVVRASERCAGIVRGFVDQARQQSASAASVDLDGIVNSTLELIVPMLRNQNVELTVHHQTDGLKVHGNRGQLGQVTLNLILNALQAMRDLGSPQHLSIETKLGRDGAFAELSVSDSGPGVPSELRAQIFEPFFTTKPMGQGTGLGLKICSDIVSAHDGQISVDRSKWGGAAFHVALPAATRHAVTARSASEDENRARTVLVVDDESDVGEVLAEIITLCGYAVELVTSANEALDRLATRTYGMSYPSMADRVAFVTGDATAADVARYLKKSATPFIEKPFTPDSVSALLQTLEQAQPRATDS